MFSLVSGMLLLAALKHVYDLMTMKGWGMGHRSVGRALETSNIVPGMPGDHPTSIPGARSRPEPPQRPLKRNVILFRKISS